MRESGTPSDNAAVTYVAPFTVSDWPWANRANWGIWSMAIAKMEFGDSRTQDKQQSSMQ